MANAGGAREAKGFPAFMANGIFIDYNISARKKMQNGWDSEVLMTEEHAHCAQIHTKNEH